METPKTRECVGVQPSPSPSSNPPFATLQICYIHPKMLNVATNSSTELQTHHYLQHHSMSATKKCAKGHKIEPIDTDFLDIHENFQSETKTCAACRAPMQGTTFWTCHRRTTPDQRSCQTSVSEMLSTSFGTFQTVGPSAPSKLATST